jgi:hypothetical protein
MTDMSPKKQNIKRQKKDEEKGKDSISEIRKKIRYQQEALIKIIKNIQQE